MQHDRDHDRPNQAANKEPAEGARENAGQPRTGISNRPLEEEQEEQRQVPDRGHSRDENETVMPGDDSTLRTKM